MDGFMWFFIGAIIAFTVIGTYKAIHKRIVAGRAGILKVCVSSVTLILQLVISGVFLYLGIDMLDKSERYFRAARSYETIMNRLDGLTGSGYQQASMKTETFTSSANPERIRNNIEACRHNGRLLKGYAIFLFIASFSDLVLASTAFWYITEAGVVLGNFKKPEPIYAVLNGEKIDINYTAQLVNVKKLKSFKATPKNLEVFGRFMVQSYPQNVQYPQDPTYPQIQQYPQNVHYPQIPQIPQSPQAPQYPQYPTYPQPRQAPQDPQDPANS